jgi:hypothetical protein
MNPKRLLENNTNTFALQISLWQEEIMLDIHIGSGALRQLLILVLPKDRGDCQLKFRFGEPR